ncbi:uncharacterized protein K452DRAFT_226940 [Aplosporella prunicola CBS 121167]|uniref:Protein kinase domain-containing protein n=1 Tax=Aplosporella prunicola CBS 121167 TaxID=1176127 RepID=A0A6A6BIG6_9PEZI|nr:uncharacterized protein K452DRAFT_226940 [Aplosporella prunicola CBS 121167]KAF2142627.1 hypothetical protein K452DRAFT_226940 [Aplosporella prunicola CBS 121167]
MPSNSWSIIQKGTSITTASGRYLVVNKIIQESETPLRRIGLAVFDNQKFILKYVPDSDFRHIQDIYSRLDGCIYVRQLRDTIKEHSILIHDYLSDDLLSLVSRKTTSAQDRKRILRDTLRGIAALHEKDIVHTDIKPNNILVAMKTEARGCAVEKVQLADIEDAAYVPPGSDIIGKLVGNRMWRSPEAHANGPVNKPSDVFSFGIVCIYAILGRVIFAVGKEELSDDVEPQAIIIERQISYFADMEGFNGLLEHLGNSQWRPIFQYIRSGFGRDNPREPITLWKDIDTDFKSLVAGLTNFDPKKRLTAAEALEHKWFQDV